MLLYIFLRRLVFWSAVAAGGLGLTKKSSQLSFRAEAVARHINSFVERRVVRPLTRSVPLFTVLPRLDFGGTAYSMIHLLSCCSYHTKSYSALKYFSFPTAAAS
jgi:hypothetical protein